jgi:hypothetical protein
VRAKGFNGLPRDGPARRDRAEIAIAVVALEPEGGRRVEGAGIEDERHCAE